VPWKEVCMESERLKFVGMYLEEDYTMSELCREFGISRKTGYKLVSRYEVMGVEGLTDLSHANHHHANAVSPEIEKDILALKGSHPSWGARKLRGYLLERVGGKRWPAASTIGEILSRHGLVIRRGRSRKIPVYRSPFVGCGESNAVWCADFKGWFRTSDGNRCDPFTLSDAYSRYLLRCQAVLRPDYSSVKPLFDAAFREYGLPEAIRTDNGAPFASLAVGGLSKLSIEWIRLGIRPERIRPGHPEENGRHERMHRTLKAETATPPQGSLRAQQRSFNRFRDIYNYERPHEALAQQTPASRYQSSPRSLPLRLPEIDYPQGYLLKRVRHRGFLLWKGIDLYLSETLDREVVGLSQQDERFYVVYFGPIKLAVLDSKTMTLKRADSNKGSDGKAIAQQTAFQAKGK
jgi:putative transposase